MPITRSFHFLSSPTAQQGQPLPAGQGVADRSLLPWRMTGTTNPVSFKRQERRNAGRVSWESESLLLYRGIWPGAAELGRYGVTTGVTGMFWKPDKGNLLTSREPKAEYKHYQTDLTTQPLKGEPAGTGWRNTRVCAHPLQTPGQNAERPQEGCIMKNIVDFKSCLHQR